MSELSRPYEDVVLYQGDDLARVQDFVERMKRAAVASADPQRLGDDVEGLASIAAEYDEFIVGAVERGVTVRVEALPGRKYRAMMAEHPPRKPLRDDDGAVVESWPDDEANGFNVETISDPLVKACADEREDFIDDLSDGNFSRLFEAAVRVNETAGPDPKARLSSAFGQISSEHSTSPERMD